MTPASERRTGAGGGALQGGDAGGAEDFGTAGGIGDAVFARATVEQFEDERAHGVDAGIAGADQRDVMAFAGTLQRVTAAGLFAAQGEIAALLACGERAEQVDIEAVAHQLFGVGDEAGDFGRAPGGLAGADADDGEAAAGEGSGRADEDGDAEEGVPRFGL